MDLLRQLEWALCVVLSVQAEGGSLPGGLGWRAMMLSSSCGLLPQERPCSGLLVVLHLPAGGLWGPHAKMHGCTVTRLQDFPSHPLLLSCPVCPYLPPVRSKMTRRVATNPTTVRIYYLEAEEQTYDSIISQMLRPILEPRVVLIGPSGVGPLEGQNWTF